MSNHLHVEALPPTGEQNEPSNLVKKKEIKRRLMEQEPVSNLAFPPTPITENQQIEDTDQTPPVPTIPRNPVELLSDAIRYTDNNELVEVFGPFGRITFRAMHVCVNDFGVAFVVSKDHMTYEPNVNTNLTLKFGGQEYTVVYAGGYFTFRQMPFTFLSFIKISTEDD